MRPVVARFVLVCALFAAWMGWLIYLAATASDPIILSRPQFLVAQLTVVAEIVEEPNGSTTELMVKEVFGPNREVSEAKSEQFPKADDKITVNDLGSAVGWRGPGTYIIPLAKADVEKKVFRVVPVPPADGVGGGSLQNIIYPANDETRWQLGKLVTPLS